MTTALDKYVPAIPQNGPPPMPLALMDETPPQNTQLMSLTHQNVAESTSGKDRANATVIRTTPMTIILAVLSIGMMVQFKLALGWTMLIFAVLTIAGYWLLNRLDYDHSPSGLERHRINQNVNIRRTELDHSYRLKYLALEAYLKLLEKHYDHH